MTRTPNRTLRMDWFLLLLVVVLSAVGLLNLRSAAAVDDMPHHVSQMLWMVIGFSAAAGVRSVDYRLAERGAWFIYITAVLLLILVPIVGTTNNTTAQRWIDLGLFQLQPSEPAKVAVILSVARFLHDREEKVPHTLLTLVQLAGIIGLPFVLVLNQPDLGTATTIGLIGCTMLVMERFRLSALIPAGIAGLIAMPVMWIFIMHDYQRERVMTLLNRAENIQEDGWQVSQSRIAIGSGEWFGKGYLRGAQVQNGFVPEHENDFVFTHHGEQFGFVGSVALIAVYAALILWALRIASRGRDRFAVLTATGIAAFIFWHVFVNLAMVMGLLPVVGLWLPLCSYGGSAMITVMGMVGILMSISIRRDVRV